MSEPKEVKNIPCWRYKRDTRKGREGRLISVLCETLEEKEHYEKIGFKDCPPELPEGQPAPEPAKSKPRSLGLDLDGDGEIDVEISERPKKKAAKKKG